MVNVKKIKVEPDSMEGIKGAYQYARRRRDSAASTSSWGSDITDPGCSCPTHDDDEIEVANWLLYAREQDWALTPRSQPPSHEGGCATFHLTSVPGPLYLQLLFAVLMYFGFVVFAVNSAPPQPPKPQQPQFPTVKFPTHNSLGRLDPAVRPDGTRIRPGESEAYHMLDDTEYVIKPRPDTNEEEMRIIMTNDYSEAKVRTHVLDIPRIYRVPSDSLWAFRASVSQMGLYGVTMRQPISSLDNISVVRQSHVSWDFGKDQYWVLVGRDIDHINAIAGRCERWWPPLSTILLKTFVPFW